MAKLDPRDAFAALSGLEASERSRYLDATAHVRFMTKEMSVWSPCGDFRELSFSDEDSTPGGLSILVPDDEFWSGYFFGQPKEAMRPIVVDLPGWRTFWLTTEFTRRRKGRQRYIEVSAVSCIEYLNWMRVFPDPGLPPEFQPSKWFAPIGPAATVCCQVTLANLLRLQGGVWPVMTHARFFRSRDDTAWTSGTYRMDKVFDAVKEIADAENLQIVPTLYIHGEDEQPFPQWHVLDRTTLIFDFVPRAHDRTFTGTLTGGLLRTGIEVAKDLIEWVVYPVADPQSPASIDEMTGRDGEVFPVYRSGEWSTATEYSETVHVGLATRITAGGKSPDWVNDIASGVVAGAIGWLGTFIGLPGLRLSFLEERVKDTVGAFHSLEDRRAAELAGPWRLREAFGESQSSGLSLQIVQSMKSTMNSHRAYRSHAIVVENGSPYLVGKHIKPGWPVGVEMEDGTVHVDRVSKIDYDLSRGAQGRVVIHVGSSDAELDPSLQGLARLRRFGSWLHRVAMGG